MELQKRAWDTPELVVLTRTTAEEGVLSACKGVISSGGSADEQSSCMLDCAMCSSVADS